MSPLRPRDDETYWLCHLVGFAIVSAATALLGGCFSSFCDCEAGGQLVRVAPSVSANPRVTCTGSPCSEVSYSSSGGLTVCEVRLVDEGEARITVQDVSGAVLLDRTVTVRKGAGCCDSEYYSDVVSLDVPAKT